MNYFRKRFIAFVIISSIVFAIGLCKGYQIEASLGEGIFIGVICVLGYVVVVDMRGGQPFADVPTGERDKILDQARSEGARRARSVVNTTQVCPVCLGRGKNAAGHICPVCNGNGLTPTNK